MVEFQGALNRVSGLMLFGGKGGLVLAGSMWYDVIWIMLNEYTSEVLFDLDIPRKIGQTVLQPKHTYV